MSEEVLRVFGTPPSDDSEIFFRVALVILFLLANLFCYALGRYHGMRSGPR